MAYIADKRFFPDGLYRVVTRHFVAGFVIAGGKVVRCAPILRRNLAYWMGQAVRVREQQK